MHASYWDSGLKIDTEQISARVPFQNLIREGGLKFFTTAIPALEMGRESIIEADTNNTTREVAEELNVDHSTVVRLLKQIGKVKKLDKWVPLKKLS
ncbi:SETMAR [Cordylochernes scorpioides]|uniref:SETMAR n=1 Tax=Cordylochernes scorpioides TaxID=51811 RepID=A0ABY6K2I6_9ARAC|nr:SETMAR [Cordylochernes scorpioides]